MKKNALKVPSIPNLYQLTSNDLLKGSEILGKAFKDDPIWLEVLKDELEKFSIVFEVPLKQCLKYGKAFGSSSNLEGIAGWLPSHKVNINFFQFILSGALRSALKLGSKLGKRIQEVFKMITEDRKSNMTVPYIYLYVIGVLPEHQGKGIGSGLVKEMLKALPPEIPLYLETETEQNVKFYEKLGFRVMKEIRVPSVDLPMWEMVHERK